MNRIIPLVLSIAFALLVMAQPVRPAASNSSPLVASIGIAPPAIFVSPLAASARARPVAEEKPEQTAPLWLVYWQWVLFRN